MNHFTESQIFYRGVEAGKALCAAGPWQYPPADPPMDGSLLLIEDDFGYSKARWDAEEKSWKDGYGIYWEVIKKNWTRWAVINEEKSHE